MPRLNGATLGTQKLRNPSISSMSGKYDLCSDSTALAYTKRNSVEEAGMVFEGNIPVLKLYNSLFSLQSPQSLHSLIIHLLTPTGSIRKLRDAH